MKQLALSFISMSGQAVEDGPVVWAQDTHVGGLNEILGASLWSGPLLTTEEVNQTIENQLIYYQFMCLFLPSL